MEARVLLDRLEKVLIEERAAIRKLDADAVGAAADEKEALYRALTAAPKSDLIDLADRLRAASRDLRQNGVLLAHARDCVRDALAIVVPAAGSSDRPANPFQVGRSPRRLFARG